MRRPQTLEANAAPPAAAPSDPDGDAPFQIDRWTVDPRARTVARGDRSLRLSPRALRLIQTLARQPGQVVSRDALLDAVWPDVIVGDDSLTQAVTEARRAFGVDAKRLIETISRRGYRLNAACAESAAPAGLLGGDPAPTAASGEPFDLEAYALCLDARAAMARGGRNVVLSVEALTREATRAAPDFAFARASHAISLCYRWLYQRNDAAAPADALGEADRATQLRPDLALGYVAKAFALGALNRPNDAVQALQTALRRDEKDADAHFIGARIMFVLQQYRSAAALAEQAARLQPDDAWSLYFGARAAAAFDPERSRRDTVLCLGRVEARLAADPTDARARNLRGPLLAMLGRTEEARAAISGQDDQETTLQVYDAIALAALGESEAAMGAIRALAERGWAHGDWLRAEPAFQAMRDEQRFKHAIWLMQAA